MKKDEQISWDPSLIKKFGSSNHLKLLNQLRNEVKKYPLNKKLNSKSNIINNILTSKVITNASRSQDISQTKKPINPTYDSNNNSTISFNNSKNFSIYSKPIKDTNKDENEVYSSE